MGSKKAWGTGVGSLVGTALLPTGVGTLAGGAAGAAIGRNQEHKKIAVEPPKTEEEIAAEQKKNEAGGEDPFSGGALTEINKKKGTFMSSGNETFSQAKLGV